MTAQTKTQTTQHATNAINALQFAAECLNGAPCLSLAEHCAEWSKLANHTPEQAKQFFTAIKTACCDWLAAA